MNEMTERGLVAFELDFYSPIIHNAWAMDNLMNLDGHFCTKEYRSEVESALIILLDMKQGVN